MKNIFCIIALLTAILHSCCHNSHLDKHLIEIDNLIHVDTDKAFLELENNVFMDDLDEFNKAYYYVLLTEIKDRKEQNLLPYDSLINTSLKVLINSTNNDLFARALISKGKIWEELESPQEALKCYLKALDLSHNDNFNLLTSVYACVGNIYFDQELWDDAFHAFHTGYIRTQADKNVDNKFTNARNLGLAYFFKEQPDSSYIYLTEAFGHARQLTDSVKLKDMIYNDLALYYNENDNNELALSYINKIEILTDAYTLNKGAIYVSLEKYDSAYIFLNRVLASNNLGTRTIALKELSELEENRGNLSQSLIYLNKFIDAYDTLSMNTFSAEIYGLNQIHNIQTEITKVKNKHNSRIVILISFCIICFLLVIVVAIIMDRKKKIRQNEERLAHERKIIEKEKKIVELQNQIANTRNKILQLRYEKKNAEEEIQEKEGYLLSMQKQLDNLRIHLFNDKPIYKKIQKLENQKESDNIEILGLKDREELNKIIPVIYADFYEELKNLCPILTEEDILFCCLAKMNFSIPLISACTGYSRTASARQRKHRIKKKMVEESDNISLYNSIFP
ncbi:MAG: hypothetical protein LUH22_12645 [Bacteroides sp.]|nr:hypothetical protein [Bacteroides sp.]